LLSTFIDLAVVYINYNFIAALGGRRLLHWYSFILIISFYILIYVHVDISYIDIFKFNYQRVLTILVALIVIDY
jgi:hypothetical protein